MFDVIWREDGDATVLGRITARNGTGAATGVAGEGNFLKVADISTITCKIFAGDSTTAATEPTVTVSTEVLDTVVTTDVLWTKDTIGYNFLHDLAAINFPTGDETYRVEYTATLTGGAVFHGSYKGSARPIRSS